MELIFNDLTLAQILFAIVTAFIAGVVKGVVGFAMPLIMLSGLSMIFPPELALAGLIVPTLVSNVFQALRQGLTAARATTVDFRIFLLIGGVTLIASAQLVRILPSEAFLFIVGCVIFGLAMLQLLGFRLRLASRTPVGDSFFGAICGVLGGLSGVWGPTTVLYLTAFDTPKSDQMRIQGVIYGLGAIALTIAHIQTGILNWSTGLMSCSFVVPALIGMRFGTGISDRIDQTAFRRATLLVLVLAGANLVRRAVFG